jgi:hypothetical protein
MQARFNKYAAAISLFVFQIAFLTGCRTPVGESGQFDHMGSLQSGAPAILATGSPEEIRQTAVADARADIAAHKPRIAITGGYAAWPTGVPPEYFEMVRRYPAVPLPCGCTSAWLKEAAIYAEAYNHQILPYLLNQNQVHD